MGTLVRWQWNAFASLLLSDLHATLALRACVFVVEQQCVFVDPDDHDLGAYRLLGWRVREPRLAPIWTAGNRVQLLLGTSRGPWSIGTSRGLGQWHGAQKPLDAL